ncbi:MAG: hypothetical protein LBT86_05490 [Deltaproteobacteria bacterium]|nr:hypothetical protein [Deltaproteobacteria bacterium]
MKTKELTLSTSVSSKPKTLGAQTTVPKPEAAVGATPTNNKISDAPAKAVWPAREEL